MTTHNFRVLCHPVFFGLLLLMMLTGTATLVAQTPLQGVDPSSIRAEDLTDTQLQQLVDRAEQEEMTIPEALQIAVQRGLPASEAAEIRRRIQQLDSGEEQDSFESRRQQSDREWMGVDDPEMDWLFESPEDEEHLIFGSRLFQERRLTFAPSAHLPTPRNYELGSGDEIIIDIWGETSNLHRLEVSPEGTVTIENIGPVYVNGLTIEAAEERLLQRLQSLYSGLRPDDGPPTMWAQVTLGNVRSIQVSLIGELKRPGTYTVSSLSTIFNALYKAGGPDSIGTYRDIRLIRDREIVSQFDVYEFLLEGDQEDNVRLKDGDVITVGTYDTRVELYGEIKREGIYELKPTESVSDLIRFAGDFSSKAYTGRVTIHRNTPTMRRVISVRDHRMDEVTLANGDSVHVDSMIERYENRVVIEGAVWREGDYEHHEGMSLHQLLQEAGGVRPDAFRSRGIISRLQDDYTFEMVAFNLDQVLQDSALYDVPLQPDDHVRIPSIFEMHEEREVRVVGAVGNPGVFDHHDDMTLEDIILQAGGFLESATEARIEVARRISDNPATEQRGQILAETFLFQVSRDLRLRDDDQDFALRPFDIVFVRENPEFQRQLNVKITGEVMYPGTYTLRERNERISDLVERAGGVTNEAYLPGGSMTRINTAVDRVGVDLDFGAEDEELENNNRSSGQQQQEQDEKREEEELEEEQPERFGDRFRDPRRERGDDRERRREQSLFDIEQFDDRFTSRIGIDLAEIMENPRSNQDLYLREGDVLNIPREMQTVRVSGAVMQDVELRHIEGDGLKRYINRAGGFTPNALEKRAYVVYANGDVERQLNYFFGMIRRTPDIKPGAEIIIPAKAERRRMESGEVVAISSAVVSMAATLAIAIDRISR